MAHNIKTPHGFQSGNGELKFDSGFGTNWSGRFTEAQKHVDAAVLRYDRPYVPKDRGKLIESGDLHTVVGSGEVVYKTPYARKWYYTPANFQGAPMRGMKWFERMKVDKKDAILREASEVMKK